MSYQNLHNRRGFFSDYYHGTIFGRAGGRGRTKSISDYDTDQAYRRFLRLRERVAAGAEDPAQTREKFIRPLLRDILGYHLGAGEERVHGLFSSATDEAGGGSPLLLVWCGGWDEDFTAGRGQQSPAGRLDKALAAARIPYGFLVSGETLRLVRAPGDGPRGACLEVDLDGLTDDYDPESFAAFYRICHLTRFTPAADGTLPIQTLEAESRKYAQTVSDDLKRAVFAAAETLIAALVGGRPADAAPPTEAELREYRDAALTALYRILFILYAEARDERLAAHGLYQQAYSIQGIIAELMRNPAADLPENRFGIWARLTALFRIYDAGLPQIEPWEHIPPRGGDFFSATTPVGEILSRAKLPDRLVARVLLDLTTTAPRHGVGRERVSFQELDIENLGAVYEGLLEYEPRLAAELVLEVALSRRTYVLPPAEVLRLQSEKGLRLKGDPELLALLSSPVAISGGKGENDETDIPLSPTGGEGEGEGADLEPDDDTDEVTKGAPLLVLRAFPPGAFHFVPGSGRKGSGSFYTPQPLVRDLVRHTLGPLVEGKTAAEIERLRVLDPACGSAHFLVEAVRFMGQALHRAYADESGTRGPAAFRATTKQGWDRDWKLPDAEARAANSEARAWCKRRIAERCLFGVDLNPTAVNLARVALWIESLAGDRPLTFFEHHFRCGNSLLGTWLDRLNPVDEKHSGGFMPDMFADAAQESVQQAAAARRLISGADSGALQHEGIDPESIGELHFKERQLKQSDHILEGARWLCDLRAADAFLGGKIAREWTNISSRAGDPKRLVEFVKSRPWFANFERIRNREQFFHWELEFPEVFLDREHPGFDAILGNPPWEKVLPNRHEFYGHYDVLIRLFKGSALDKRIREIEQAQPDITARFAEYRDRVNLIAEWLKNSGDYHYHQWQIEGKSTGGHQDLFKFFVERAWQLVGTNGRVGLVVPSAIYNNEGCTGLRHLLLDKSKVERFYGFENREKIFDIDSRMKFISMVFSKTDAAQQQTPSEFAKAAETDGNYRAPVAFEAAFMRHDLDELESTGPKPWMVTIRRDELERISPGTLTFLEYRDKQEHEILLKMSHGQPLLGAKGSDTWSASFYSEFNLTNDKDLWSDPKTGKLWSVNAILGKEPADFAETRARMLAKGYWPLYQDAHIHQFVLEFKPLMRWVSIEAHDKKYSEQPVTDPKIVIRDMARSTDERTCIAALLPPNSGFGHTLNGARVAPEFQDAFIALLNSQIFDYSARKRVGGQHVSPYILQSVAVPPPAALVGKIKPIPHLHANQKQTWVYDHEEYWPLLWHNEKVIASAYNLTPTDLEYILSTFPIFTSKRHNYYKYMASTLISK